MDAFQYRLLAAQRDLIERCGTVERVAAKCGYSKSEVGRWRGGANPEFMPVGVIALLEGDCGYALVTSVLAEANGRRLTDPDAERAADVGVLTAHADMLIRQAESLNALAQAIADGHVTPNEATIVDRKLSEQERATSDLRAALSVIKARGGDRAALKVVE